MKQTKATQSAPGAVSLSNEPAVKQVLAESILGLWNVVNNLTRLEPSKRERYRVTIFGSARVQPGTPGYEITKQCAAELANLGCDIITGGGPGLMQAANEGASTAPDKARSIGIRVQLPFEQDVNSYVEQAFEHRTFFTRLHQFAMASDAFIVAPGGIGTVLETLTIWQLIQVGHLRNTPLILVGKMWPGLVSWAASSMVSTDPPLAGEQDMKIPVCVETADAAIAAIRKHRTEWRRKNQPTAHTKPVKKKSPSRKT